VNVAPADQGDSTSMIGSYIAVIVTEVLVIGLLYLLGWLYS
jgi:hypothetical protein